MESKARESATDRESVGTDRESDGVFRLSLEAGRESDGWVPMVSGRFGKLSDRVVSAFDRLLRDRVVSAAAEAVRGRVVSVTIAVPRDLVVSVTNEFLRERVVSGAGNGQSGKSGSAPSSDGAGS